VYQHDTDLPAFHPPRTIEKPLISHALQHFGFHPATTASPAIELRVAPLDASNPDSPCAMWSPEMHRLKSKVSKRTMKSQNCLIVEECPADGKRVWINTPYDKPPDMKALWEVVDLTLADSELDMAQAYAALCRKHPPRAPT